MNMTIKTDEVKVPKKRGRKPKGGKLIQKPENPSDVIVPEPNIILHLKCGENDLQTKNVGKENVDSFQFDSNPDLPYQIINNKKKKHVVNDEGDEQKNMWKKLNELASNLHTNNISDKRSACFWCTCDFDNPPIYIPKYELNNTYHCYGCFCSPECSVSYLFNEHIDVSTRVERYSLLNHLYCKIYDYNKNIKPAPNPHYLLDKFYGNLTIQEYRKLLKNERLLLIVDKPLTRILPELHEDNDDFLLNQQSIPSSTKFTLRKSKPPTKKEILTENFNIKS
jgi:hypothetical protein|tara:strand:- start:851 stop:1690 length:840 start_codon:yes stop_codon:yes gene_type:complete